MSLIACAAEIVLAVFSASLPPSGVGRRKLSESFLLSQTERSIKSQCIEFNTSQGNYNECSCFLFGSIFLSAKKLYYFL